MKPTKRGQAKPPKKKPGTKHPGNPTGATPKFTSPKEMQTIIDAYFEKCIKLKKPYTVVGLALSLGFCERKSLIDYTGKIDFVHTIKKAKARIEEQRNEQLITDGNAAGKIFDLKNNFKWVDQTEHALTGKDGGPIETKSTMTLDEATRLYLDNLK